MSEATIEAGSAAPGGALPDWTQGQEGIVYESCNACGKVSYFRRGFCPSCGAAPVDVRASRGHGTVYASTTVVRALSPEWKAVAPYAIVLVDLDERIRVMAHGSPGLAIGERVRIGWLRIGERLIPRAEPFSAASEATA